MLVGPSRLKDEWRAFFGAQTWTPAELVRLIAADDPGAAFFEIETQINGLYRSVQRAREAERALGMSIVDPNQVGEIQFKARWLEVNASASREALGAAQRELDLGLMRWMRRASCLSLVIGAGVTMDAGGPSWAELVRRLLTLVMERGREISEMRPTPESTEGHRVLERVVVAREQLPAAARETASETLAQIAAGTAGTEALMKGAQLCYDFLGQALFTEVTQILYENERKPGAIHRAIAELASPILVPDRGGWFPGWDAIITYNFDDLAGEALDAAGLARAAYAMRGNQIAGDPNDRAREAGVNALHQRILHLHGYTPRRLFQITEVRYVFSTSQYEKTYGGAQAGIIGAAFDGWLANPIHHALYVGCSFEDEEMNRLLRDAAAALPGRYHYALLKWPGTHPRGEATPDEIARESARYLALGVRPIWCETFAEIPELIRSLA